MAYILIGLGLVIAYLDYQGSANLKAAGSLIYDETFGGNPPFYKWAGAMIIIGAIGYIPDMEPVAMAFIILVLAVMILSHRSGFATLVKGL